MQGRGDIAEGPTPTRSCHAGILNHRSPRTSDSLDSQPWWGHDNTSDANLGDYTIGLSTSTIALQTLKPQRLRQLHVPCIHICACSCKFHFCWGKYGSWPHDSENLLQPIQGHKCCVLRCPKSGLDFVATITLFRGWGGAKPILRWPTHPST